ncbi:MAG: EI24 domain-containing protein [Salinivirgaceae bacterium]|nr:EI24 domain-containing protein [Salinivirgaceae bacterium]
MSTFNGFSTGFSSFFKAIPFIFKNKLAWTFLIPLILYIIIYAGGFTYMDHLGDIVSNYITRWLEYNGDSNFLQKLPGILSWIAKFLIQILFFFIFAYFSGYIILIILSPLFAWLSERTDQIINATNYPFEWKQFAKDIWRGILIALRNLLLELGITILVIVATFIPVLNIISGPLAGIFLFIASSYFYGFSFMDYTCERKRLKVKESILFVKRNKGMAIANGMLFSISLFIPFLGGFVAIIATVGATMAMNEIPELKKIDSQFAHI